MTEATYAQKPRDKNKTEQIVGKPWSFIHACARRFGMISVDLAASPENAKAPVFYTEADDSLMKPWAKEFPGGNLWLNPPFKNIAPWASKCFGESRERAGLILMLVPASIGSAWFASFVHNKAQVLALPRMTFEGHPTPYPKDLMLCVYGMGFSGFDIWDYRR